VRQQEASFISLNLFDHYSYQNNYSLRVRQREASRAKNEYPLKAKQKKEKSELFSFALSGYPKKPFPFISTDTRGICHIARRGGFRLGSLWLG